MNNQNKSAPWTCMSEKARNAGSHWMTIFTPAYQRETTMERLYKTLLTLHLPEWGGRIIDFEWVVVNDGSTDKTDEMMRRWCHDVNTIDMRLKYHVKGEMCGFNRTDLMKSHPFPTPDSRMRFCPKGIVWFEIAREGYKERIVDVPVHEYYRDATNAITGPNFNRAISNYYGWQYGVNHLLGYLIYSPKEILKNVVGMSRDGFVTKRSVNTIVRDAHSFLGKCLVLMFMPIGYLLSKK